MKVLRSILLGMAALLSMSACGTTSPTASADASEVRSGAVFSTETTTSSTAAADSGSAQTTAERGGLMFGSGH
jgi:ABC-type glycerol-3-phosphate transport system substrate-binding protein